MSNLRRLAATLSLLFICGAASAQEWLYTVRPGDEIWNIASRYCGSPSFAERIVQHNQLPDARRIRPGSRLRIPIAWLVRQPVTAEVTKVRGEAELLSPEPKPAQVGDDIEMGHRLRTGDGTAVVGFADGSSLIIAAESDVLFNVLTAFGDTGMVDTNLRFYRGRGTSRIVRRAQGSRFRISSPVGTAAVRGTEFRVAVESTRTLTETLEGEVGFIQDTETAIPGGFGLAASETELVREALLPAPVWSSTPGRYASGATLNWTNLNGAVGYRASVYLASDRDAPVQVKTVTRAALPLEGLSPGVYAVAVRGISASDLEGFESTLNFDLGTQPPTPATTAVFDTNSVSLNWAGVNPDASYTLEVARDDGFDDMVLREEQLSNATATPQLPAGYYHWRVKDLTSAFSSGQAITVRPAPPGTPRVQRHRLELSLDWSSSGADSFELTISRNPDFSAPVVRRELTEPTFQDSMPGVGSYHIEITAVANGVSSTPTRLETTLTQRPPWWLLALFLAPLLF